MTTTEREIWLIVDDSASDRRRLVTALADLGDKVELLLASTVSEAQELLLKHPIELCLFDFYLRGTTTERLITSVRAKSPELPIVVISGQAGVDKRIYNAGADAVVPKVTDSKSFATMVKSAVLHARTLRQMKAGRVRFETVYLGPEVARLFRQVLKQPSGHVLVSSPTGMGRTSLARSLAERIRSRSEASHGREVLTLTLASLDEGRSVDELLFGKPQTGRLPERGLLEAAQDAVLVIDDAHLLPDGVLLRLKALFKRGVGESNTGTLITANRLRILFTVLTGAKLSEELTDFFETHIAFRIAVPSFAELQDEKKALVEFAFRRAVKAHRRPLMAECGLLTALLKATRKTPHRVSARSLFNALAEATKRALDDGRERVVVSDLGNMESVFEPEPEATAVEPQEFTLPLDDKLGIEPWQELYNMARNGSFEEATQVLRKLMVEYAMLRHHGNKTRVAEQLGVARQHLYKPCLRGFVGVGDD